jgi:hypothetical protein
MANGPVTSKYHDSFSSLFWARSLRFERFARKKIGNFTCCRRLTSLGWIDTDVTARAEDDSLQSCDRLAGIRWIDVLAMMAVCDLKEGLRPQPLMNGRPRTLDRGSNRNLPVDASHGLLARNRAEAVRTS